MENDCFVAALLAMTVVVLAMTVVTRTMAVAVLAMTVVARTMAVAVLAMTVVVLVMAVVVRTMAVVARAMTATHAFRASLSEMPGSWIKVHPARRQPCRPAPR